MWIRGFIPIALLGLSAPLAASAPPAAPNDVRSETVQFARGTSSRTIKGSIKGYAAVNYVVQANAGQTMTVTVKTSNKSSYFNVTAPGADTAMFIGSDAGNRFSQKIASSGAYTVNMYLMRNAARRGETANYTLTIALR